MSTSGFLGALAIGLVLGVRHALEPDHLIAVSTIASRSRTLRRAALAGVFWGLGHTLALLAVGLTLVLLRGELPATWSLGFELAVGAMLVYLGLGGLVGRWHGDTHVHEHVHDGEAHRHYHGHPHTADRARHAHAHDTSYRRSTLVGVLHGMAGSAAVALLGMSATANAWQAAAYVLVFGAGTVIAMLASTALIGLPFVAAPERTWVHRALARATGATSAVYGCYYTYHVGAAHGLFSLWSR